MSMHVLALHVDLRFPACQSLKQKRAVLKPLVVALRSRFEVSVAEVAHHNAWQRAELGIAVVGYEPDAVSDFADRIDRFLWAAANTEILSIDRHWLEVGH